MPLPGGTSAKVGLRYEALWTVCCIAEILAERADAIRVEPPGREGEGVEFWFRLPGSVEYHQVKRQNARGHWTLGSLVSEGVLGHFKDKLGDPNARCVFVSVQDAPELHELGDRARRASSAEEFRRHVGLDPTRLTSRQWDLLALPLHLSLVAEIAGAGDSDVFDLEVAQDLYDRFWSRKQDVLRERLGRPVRWTEVIDAVVEYMSTHQVLSVPESTLDAVEADAKAMASEHVLVLDGGRYGFFHEGFFDYAFARRFVARGGNLLQLLGESEQHLFRRAQIRQILLHERDENRSRYLADLKWLLTAPAVRFNLRTVVFALLSQVRDPTSEEWRILEPLTEVAPSRSTLLRRLERATCEAGVNILRHLAPTALGLRGRLSSRLLHEAVVDHAWSVLYRSGAWFLLLKSLTVIERWLKEPSDSRVDRTVTLLSRMQRSHADHVAELLEPYVGVPGLRGHRFHTRASTDPEFRDFLDDFEGSK